MIKRYWILALLAVFITACASNQPSRPVQPDGAVPPAEPIATAAEKVVTLVPRGQATDPAPPPAAAAADLLTDAAAQETAAENLRALLGVPELMLAVQSAENSPNAINIPAVVFVDELGNSYHISQQTLKPVEFTLQRPYHAENSTPKTPEELLAAAQQIAKTHSTRFETLQDKLKYIEGAKNAGNFFYRWEMPGTDMGGMPAILQIGLKQDGTLFSYLNSIDYLP